MHTNGIVFSYKQVFYPIFSQIYAEHIEAREIHIKQVFLRLIEKAL